MDAIAYEAQLEAAVALYQRLGGFHPDLSLELSEDEEPLHVPDRETVAILKGIAAERGISFLDMTEDGKYQREKAEAATTKFVPVDR